MRKLLPAVVLCLGLFGCSEVSSPPNGNTTTALKAIINFVSAAESVKQSANLIFLQLKPLLPDDVEAIYTQKFDSALASLSRAIGAARQAVEFADSTTTEDELKRVAVAMVDAGKGLQTVITEIRATISRGSRRVAQGDYSQPADPVGLRDFNQALEDLEKSVGEH